MSVEADIELLQMIVQTFYFWTKGRAIKLINPHNLCFSSSEISSIANVKPILVKHASKLMATI